MVVITFYEDFQNLFLVFQSIALFIPHGRTRCDRSFHRIVAFRPKSDHFICQPADAKCWLYYWEYLGITEAISITRDRLFAAAFYSKSRIFSKEFRLIYTTKYFTTAISTSYTVRLAWVRYFFKSFLSILCIMIGLRNLWVFRLRM